jgi:FSR family fosmidomycin resistance protein-like MFS transporter
MISTHTRVNAVISTGHFFSHFYVFAAVPLFGMWQDEFGIGHATVALTITLMSGTTAVLQTPAGFLVDRYGAKPFLIYGMLLMSVAVAMMAFATSFWQILVLAILSGVGNSVFHPVDYTILNASIPREKLGRSFAYHLSGGNIGFALGTPVVALLVPVVGWRMSLLIIGLAGLPVIAAVLLQSSILSDRVEGEPGTKKRSNSAALLFSKPMLLFFAFFMLGSIAQSGIQTWLIQVLQDVHGLSLEVASGILTGFLTGVILGTFIGGWVSDIAKNHQVLLASVLVVIAAVTILIVGELALPNLALLVIAAVSGLALGASRVSRDLIVKNVTPPGEVGKVFGFVSTGLPLGLAIAPVTLGFLIDIGHTEYVLVAAAGILLLSMLCGGTAGMGEHPREAAPRSA